MSDSKSTSNDDANPIMTSSVLVTYDPCIPCIDEMHWYSESVVWFLRNPSNDTCQNVKTSKETVEICLANAGKDKIQFYQDFTALYVHHPNSFWGRVKTKILRLAFGH